MAIWIMVRKGYIKCIHDEDVNEKVIDMVGAVGQVKISTPTNMEESLGISMYWLSVVFKAMDKRVVVSAQVLDDTKMKRLFRFDSGCIRCKSTSIFTRLPLVINEDWNCLEVNLMKYLRNFYGTDLVEITRVEVQGSCRLRRVYTSYESLAQVKIPYDSRILQ